MSHWTLSALKIKDLGVMERVAKKLGLNVERGEDLSFKSSYAEGVGAKMILTDNRGGSCAVVENEQGDGYQTIIDNWNNPITSVVGHDCAGLNREYATQLVKDKASETGAMLSTETTLKTGEVQLVYTL